MLKVYSDIFEYYAWYSYKMPASWDFFIGGISGVYQIAIVLYYFVTHLLFG